MGELYEAEDLALGERVALKTIRPEIASDERAHHRFLREIQLACKVTHPNICRIFDLFEQLPASPSHAVFCRRLISTPKNGNTRTVSMSTGVPAENTQFEVPVRATLGSGSREGMGVRVSPFAPITCRTRSRHLANSRGLNAP
jgi:hypothetical protein